MPGDGGTEFDPLVFVQVLLSPGIVNRPHPNGGVVPVPIASKFCV